MNKKQLKEKYGEEKVFVVPFEKLEFIKDGFTEVEHNSEIWGMFDNLGKFVYRYDAEGESAMQQIIPYILILNEDGTKVFATKRIAGDSRLANKVSIACGGHIDSSDGNREVLFRAAVRELLEEVEVDASFSSPLQIFGYVRDLNSTTNDHTGVAIIVRASGDVQVKEKDKLVGEWMSLDDLVNEYEKLENWSKYIIDHFVTKKSFI